MYMQRSYGASLPHTLSAGYVAILNCNKNTYKFFKNEEEK